MLLLLLTRRLRGREDVLLFERGQFGSNLSLLSSDQSSSIDGSLNRQKEKVSMYTRREEGVDGTHSGLAEGKEGGGGKVSSLRWIRRRRTKGRFLLTSFEVC